MCELFARAGPRDLAVLFLLWAWADAFRLEGMHKMFDFLRRTSACPPACTAAAPHRLALPPAAISCGSAQNSAAGTLTVVL